MEIRVSQVGDTHPRRDTLSWGHDFQFTIKNMTSKIMLDSRGKYFFSHNNYIKKPSRLVQPIFNADLESALHSGPESVILTIISEMAKSGAITFRDNKKGLKIASFH